MNILICDDEKNAVEAVGDMIKKKYGDKHNVVTFCTPEEVGEYVNDKNNSVDLAVMDIELKSSDGMKLSFMLKNIYPELEIIYFTGYADKYDEDIFMLTKPFGLLRKPICEEKLYNLLDSLAQSEQAISIVSGSNNIKIALKSIMYIERQGRKTSIVMATDTFASYVSLDKIERQLNKNFIRVHNSFYVNYNYIDDIKADVCVLITGKSIPVSRKYSKQAKTQFLLLKGHCL